MPKLIKLVLCVLSFCGAIEAFAGSVTVQGRRLFVDGKQFNLKGVCYSPEPVDYDWTYKWADVAAIYNSDLPLIKAMGANTVRTYHERNITKAFLDSAYQNGLYVIAGWGEELWDKDLSIPANRLKYLNDFTVFINNYKNHPAILMWNFGNEVEEHTADKIAWYTLLSSAAVIAHSIDPDHPVTTANQEITEIGDTSLNASDSMNAVDIWGINVYRGENFSESFFTEISTRTAKPYFFSEWGCDAFNGVTGAENQAIQDKYIRSQWAEIESNLTLNGKNCAGGLVFEWCDEWWKGAKIPGDITTLGQGGLKGRGSHDTATDWLNDAYTDDMNMNEEWWGIVSVSPGTALRTPRAIYYSLRELWNPSVNAVPLTASTIIQNEIRSYPNPFIAGKNAARIEFTVAGSPSLELAIFDLAGSKVFQQDNIFDLGSGVRAADWDGKDEDNNFVPAGLYVCRVRAKTQDREETKYRKIAVVK